MRPCQLTVPEKYRQPIRAYYGRDVVGTLERVDYVPETHLRIWYNCQTEGYAPHHHAATEIIVALENDYLVTVNGTEYHLRPGDILFVPPHALHSIVGNAGARFIMLIDFEPVKTLMDVKACEPLFLMRTVCFREEEDPEFYKNVRGYLDRITDIYFKADNMWELFIFSELLKLLADTARHLFERTAGFSAGKNKNFAVNYEKFASLLTYVDTHYMEDLSLEWAADRVGFSKYYFHRLFAEYSGMTFRDHLESKRIQVAERLLSAGQGQTVSEIASAVGFNTASSFDRAFRKCTGMSPTQYRKLKETEDEHGMSRSVIENEEPSALDTAEGNAGDNVL